MNSLWRYEQDDYVSQFFQIHAENPQARLIKQAVEATTRLRVDSVEFVGSADLEPSSRVVIDERIWD